MRPGPPPPSVFGYHLPRWGRISLAALLAAACTPAPHQAASGAQPTFVSLNPCADAILVEVADPGQILAISRFSHDPASSSMGLAAASRFPATSGSVEEIAALRPDIVLGDQFLGPATSGALARLGFRLEQYRIEPTVEFSEVQVRAIAKLAGHPERGEALVGRMRAALAAAAPPPGADPIPAVVWQSSGIVPGEGTLVTDLLRRTGFTSFSAAQGLGQADVLPLERMLANPPQVILAAGNAQSEEDRLLRHPALAALTNTRREPLSSTLLWCGGPTVIKAGARLAEIRGRVALRPPPPTPSSEEEGASKSRDSLPLLFRGGGRGVVQ